MCPSVSNRGGRRGEPLSSTRRSHIHIQLLPTVSLFNLPLLPTCFHSLFLSLSPMCLSSLPTSYCHLIIFFTSSLVSLMSHTGVYHSLCPSRPPFSLLSPFVRPSTFIQSPKWICLMGPAFVQPSRASATEMYYMYRSANKNTDKCATLHAHASMHALSSFANRDVPELKDTSRNINIMYLFAE